MLKRIGDVLAMIKVEHTVFALPFAVVGMFWAAGGFPGWAKVGWILLAMVSARSAAMAFNRIADRRLDAENPRTRDRHIPAGRISAGFASGFTLLMAALFVLSARMLNDLCLYLSPAALAVILGYSYTKRVTILSHFVLGLSLAMAPVGAWLAVLPEFSAVPILFAAAVLFWVAGFDIIYSLLDVDFDRRAKLHSVPARFGVPAAMVTAALLHGLTVVSLVAVAHFTEVGTVYLAGVGVILLLLLWEHATVRPEEPAKVQRAFFTVNAVVSLTLMAAALGDLFLRRAG